MSKFREREIVVHGQPMRVYSADGWRWFSDREEAVNCGQKREQFLESMARSLKKSSTFKSRTRRIVRD